MSKDLKWKLKGDNVSLECGYYTRENVLLQ